MSHSRACRMHSSQASSSALSAASSLIHTSNGRLPSTVVPSISFILVRRSLNFICGLDESGNKSLHRLDIITLILEDLAIRRGFLVPCNRGKGIVLAVVVLVNKFTNSVLVIISCWRKKAGWGAVPEKWVSSIASTVPGSKRTSTFQNIGSCNSARLSWTSEAFTNAAGTSVCVFAESNFETGEVVQQRYRLPTVRRTTDRACATLHPAVDFSNEGQGGNSSLGPGYVKRLRAWLPQRAYQPGARRGDGFAIRFCSTRRFQRGGRTSHRV